ncbi:hypothetical protein SCLCIDRAFT_99252, partial [Scleroderma citrinum Foug A]
MRPSATQFDLPMTHNICMYIHNAFVDLLKDLKDNIQLPTSGKISTTMDLWSADQTKASFFRLTTH